MSYHCPKCKTPIDTDISFQITGQCLCPKCGEIVDLTTASTPTANNSPVRDLDKDEESQ